MTEQQQIDSGQADPETGPAQHGDMRRWKRIALPVFYGLMTGGGIAAFLVIQSLGASLMPPAGSEPAQPAASWPHINTLAHVLLALAVIIAVTRLAGAVFRYFHQPPVIGEIIGGIFLGPSILGRALPGVQDAILPGDIQPILGILAQLGVILFMFLIGLELNTHNLRKSGHAVLAISHVSIVLPFVLGAMLALLLFERYAEGAAGFTGFALFLGVAMAVTAFPVLARILTERGLHRTRIGSMAITIAAVDDVTAWCLLALVVSVVHAEVSGALLTMGLTVLFIAGVVIFLRPLVKRGISALEARGRVSEGGAAVIFTAVLVSALTTEFIGIHALFGAFLLGAIIPHDSRIAREMTERLESVVKVMLLPVFFAYTGMRTEMGLLNSTEDWLFCGLIILVATAGKFGGAFVTAKLSGINTADAASLGVLMNTRGLVELIVLNIGLDLGVISPRLFAMLVIMALVTTFMTTPALDIIKRRRGWGNVSATLESRSLLKPHNQSQ